MEKNLFVENTSQRLSFIALSFQLGTQMANHLVLRQLRKCFFNYYTYRWVMSLFFNACKIPLPPIQLFFTQRKAAKINKSADVLQYDKSSPFQQHSLLLAIEEFQGKAQAINHRLQFCHYKSLLTSSAAVTELMGIPIN